MQSDPGTGSPHTGGDDDAVWRDLVARLEEVPDAFLDDPAEFAGSGDPAVEPGGKGVNDFDPLGVWAQQSGPAPREPAASAADDGGADDGGSSSFSARDYAGPQEDEEFVPEEPPSLRGTEPALMLSWIGAAGGPLFLVFSAIFWRQIPMTLVFAVIAAFLAGTGYLLYRLPNQRDHDGGDGAVV